MTEEQIQATWVGEPSVHDAPIELVEYDPSWPQLFRREEERIRAGLGERVVRPEYVGSTAVPGRPAKPIIDMCLVVADSSDEGSYMRALQAAGCVLRIREPGWYEDQCFKGPDTDVNLHVYSEGCPEIGRYLLFRDRLRTNQAASCTTGPSASWRSGSGSTSRTTPTRRPLWSRRPSRALAEAASELHRYR